MPSVDVRQAGMDDIDEVVKIHQAAFPDFFMTRLGSRFLRNYYRLVMEYPNGVLLVAGAGGPTIMGFVAGFVDPVRFYQSFRKRRIAFAMACVPALLRDPRLLPELLGGRRRVGDAAESQHDSRFIAELSSVAVDPTAGGQGIGRTVMTAFVDRARALGSREVQLTTDADDNDRVNGFYRTAGFTLTRTFQQGRARRMNEYVLRIG